MSILTILFCFHRNIIFLNKRKTRWKLLAFLFPNFSSSNLLEWNSEISPTLTMLVNVSSPPVKIVWFVFWSTFRVCTTYTVRTIPTTESHLARTLSIVRITMNIWYRAVLATLTLFWVFIQSQCQLKSCHMAKLFIWFLNLIKWSPNAFSQISLRYIQRAGFQHTFFEFWRRN